jgi:glycosyltransferase involved in cell wall biosynthesis
VTFLGPVPQADLPALYSAATLFVFPSLYEGFGLPVLEAMACGTPVVCSRIPSLVEIAAEAACYLPPTDHQQIAEAVLRLWEDREVRTQLKERGFRRARGFSWQKSAASTLKVYRRVTRQPSN